MISTYSHRLLLMVLDARYWHSDVNSSACHPPSQTMFLCHEINKTSQYECILNTMIVLTVIKIECYEMVRFALSWVPLRLVKQWESNNLEVPSSVLDFGLPTCF